MIYSEIFPAILWGASHFVLTICNQNKYETNGNALKINKIPSPEVFY